MIIAVNFRIYETGKKKPEKVRASTVFEPVTVSVKFSVDCSFRLDLSVRGCILVVNYLDS